MHELLTDDFLSELIYELKDDYYDFDRYRLHIVRHGMKNLFQRASSPWVRYSEYEYKKAEEGQFYITPAVGAKPEIYDPLKDAEQMVLGALR